MQRKTAIFCCQGQFADIYETLILHHSETTGRGGWWVILLLSLNNSLPAHHKGEVFAICVTNTSWDKLFHWYSEFPFQKSHIEGLEYRNLLTESGVTEHTRGAYSVEGTPWWGGHVCKNDHVGNDLIFVVWTITRHCTCYIYNLLQRTAHVFEKKTISLSGKDWFIHSQYAM